MPAKLIFSGHLYFQTNFRYSELFQNIFKNHSGLFQKSFSAISDTFQYSFRL